ncbi:MAG: selenide, water dikinase SelD [Alphaproteobacteria bacterium]|nr:selenide, water dikinase SelD [Alphaproteobacteria bacterium]
MLNLEQLGGCSCKIPASTLEKILLPLKNQVLDHHLILGHGHNEDCAVYNLGNDNYLVFTTDFFTPVVPNLFDFGQIAAANALSDIYAMGGKPIMAISVLGYDTSLNSVEDIQEILAGAKKICNEAHINICGGHTIESKSLFFGLAVTGLCSSNHLKRNNTLTENDYLFITKPLGSGISLQALKKNKIAYNDMQETIGVLTTLNAIGETIGSLDYVTAMTDLTGFGIVGHLTEMIAQSNLSIELYFDNIPILSEALPYLTLYKPDACFRNFSSYNNHVEVSDQVDAQKAFSLLYDPQTNGGLIFGVNEAFLHHIIKFLTDHHLNDFIKPIGKVVSKKSKPIWVGADPNIEMK